MNHPECPINNKNRHICEFYYNHIKTNGYKYMSRDDMIRLIEASMEYTKMIFKQIDKYENVDKL